MKQKMGLLWQLTSGDTEDRIFYVYVYVHTPFGTTGCLSSICFESELVNSSGLHLFSHGSVSVGL